MDAQERVHLILWADGGCAVQLPLAVWLRTSLRCRASGWSLAVRQHQHSTFES